MDQQTARTDISRRTFLQGALYLGAFSGLMGFGLVGCSSPASTAAEGWKAGTYQANVTGHNAPFTIQVTFSDSAITAIDTSTNQESLGVGASALEDLADQILQYQTLDVDSVTGATLSSMCLQQGVKDCAEQAGATKDLEKAAGPEDDVESSYDADVCVVGGGGAGLTAAISAAQAGAKVVVIEKCGITGGSTNVSEGALNAVDPERQQKQGIEDSVEKFYETTFEGGHQQGTPELIKYLTDNALDSVHWLESLGVKFKDEVGSATGSLGERSHYPATPSGNTYIRSFEQYIEDHPDQITMLHEMQAKELLVEKGAVSGVKAVHRGNLEVTVNAPAVVIATGGFGANVSYRQEVNTGVWADVKLDDSIGCTNIKPCAQGEGLKLAEAAGAELIGLSDIQLHPCGTPGTGLMEDIRTSGRNRHLREQERGALRQRGSRTRHAVQGDFRATRHDVLDRREQGAVSLRNRARRERRDYREHAGARHIVKGETVEDLAKQTQMDPAKLQASIDGYNKTVAGEAEDPFGFQANNTADQQLTEGPWYACQRCRPCTTRWEASASTPTPMRSMPADRPSRACSPVENAPAASTAATGLAATPSPTASRSAAMQARTRRHSQRPEATFPAARPTPAPALVPGRASPSGEPHDPVPRAAINLSSSSCLEWTFALRYTVRV